MPLIEITSEKFNEQGVWNEEKPTKRV